MMTEQEKEKVITRLKAAADADPMGMKPGRELGRKWAMEHASPRLLREVTKWVNRPLPEDEEAPVGASPLGKDLAYFIAGTEDYSTAAAYCKSLGETGAYLWDSDDFAAGFVKGALDIWGEVEGDVADALLRAAGKSEAEPSAEVKPFLSAAAEAILRATHPDATGPTRRNS